MSTAGSHAPLLGPADPPPVLERSSGGESPYLLVCDHAGRRIPAGLGNLGLPAHARRRHIAWDLGAAVVCAQLAQQLGAHALLQRYSRLVIDCNRPLDAPDSIVPSSDGDAVPGNHALAPDAIAARRDAIFLPWHERIRRVLDARARAGQPTLLLAIHSFTPSLETARSKGSRPWQVGVMYHRQPALARALLAQLAQHPSLTVGDNEPYALSDVSDYTLPEHGERRGIPCAGIEIRQDLLVTAGGRHAWSGRLATALTEVLRANAPDSL